MDFLLTYRPFPLPKHFPPGNAKPKKLAYLGLLRQNRWTEKVLSGPKSCSSIPSRQWMCQNGRPRSTRENPQLVGNASNEKVKPISLTLQNKLKGFTFKIVLFDNKSAQKPLSKILLIFQFSTFLVTFF